MCAKLYATVNASADPIVLERPSPSAAWCPEGAEAPDLVRTGPGLFSVVHKGRSYSVLVLKEDQEAGTVRMRIGSHCHTVRMEDDRTRLMQLLGIDRGARAMVGELKAPMPGLVLKVLVKKGDQVKKGDALLVLEAMKMENVIKSAGDAMVTNVYAKENTAVEKGQPLVSFE